MKTTAKEELRAQFAALERRLEEECVELPARLLVTDLFARKRRLPPWEWEKIDAEIDRLIRTFAAK